MKTWGAFPAGLLAGLAIVAAQIPYGGLLVPVFAVPAYALLGIAALLGLVVAVQSPRPQARGLPVLLGLLFLGWMLWRAWAGPPTAETHGWIRLILACGVIYFLFAGALAASGPRMLFLGVILAAALIQAGLGAYQFLRNPHDMPIPWLSEQLRLWYEGPLQGNKRAHGFFINGIHLAWFLNIASLSALALGCWSRLPTWARVCAIYVAAVGFAVALTTLSRGGVVGLLGGLGLFLVASAIAMGVGGRGRRVALVLGLIGGLTVAAGSAALVLSESFLVQYRMTILLDDTYRPLVTQATLRQFQREPILGGGPGAFKFQSREYRGFASPTDDMFAHNDWAQVASDFGYPAFALLVMLVVALYGSGFKGLCLASRYAGAGGRAVGNSVAIHVAALAALTSSALHALFDFSMQIPANALLTSAMAGMLANPGIAIGSGAWSRRATSLFGGLSALVCGLGGVALLWLLIHQAPQESALLQAENLLLQGHPKRVIEQTTRHLELHPADYDFMLLRSRALIEATGQFNSQTERTRASLRAATDLRTASKIRPLDPFQEISLGMAEGRLGNFEAAELAGARAIAAFPLYSGGYEVLGMALEAQDRPGEALSVYALGARLPDSARIRARIRPLREQMKK